MLGFGGRHTRSRCEGGGARESATQGSCRRGPQLDGGGNQDAITQKLYTNIHCGIICSSQTASTDDWVSKNDRSMVI